MYTWLVVLRITWPSLISVSLAKSSGPKPPCPMIVRDSFLERFTFFTWCKIHIDKCIYGKNLMGKTAEIITNQHRSLCDDFLYDLSRKVSLKNICNWLLLQQSQGRSILPEFRRHNLHTLWCCKCIPEVKRMMLMLDLVTQQHRPSLSKSHCIVLWSQRKRTRVDRLDKLDWYTDDR